jgi:DNA-binding NarL/FixJ family response regulator
LLITSSDTRDVTPHTLRPAPYCQVTSSHFANSRVLRRKAPMRTVSPNPTVPRLLIADDHAMFAETLRDYLEKTYTVVGLVMDGRAMFEQALQLRPDVIVVDVGMPLMNGLDAARRIKVQAPCTKFVFLTMRDDPNLAAAALALGPIGFVLKHSTGPELLNAIDHVLHGKPYLTPKLRAEDWVATNARARQFSKCLTRRQREVVQLFAEGLPMKQIAGVLNLSEKTVEFHKHHIMGAFNLRSNAELVLFAVKEGLVSVEPSLQSSCVPSTDVS